LSKTAHTAEVPTPDRHRWLLAAGCVALVFVTETAETRATSGFFQLPESAGDNVQSTVENRSPHNLYQINTFPSFPFSPFFPFFSFFPLSTLLLSTLPPLSNFPSPFLLFFPFFLNIPFYSHFFFFFSSPPFNPPCHEMRDFPARNDSQTTVHNQPDYKTAACSF